MPLDSRGQLAKLWSCTLESKKLEDAPEQGQCLSVLGSQVESCGRCGASSTSQRASLFELISLSYVLYSNRSLRLHMGSSYDCSHCREKNPNLSLHKGFWGILVISPQYFVMEGLNSKGENTIVAHLTATFSGCVQPKFLIRLCSVSSVYP